MLNAVLEITSDNQTFLGQHSYFSRQLIFDGASCPAMAARNKIGKPSQVAMWLIQNVLVLCTLSCFQAVLSTRPFCVILISKMPRFRWCSFIKVLAPTSCFFLVRVWSVVACSPLVLSGPCPKSVQLGQLYLFQFQFCDRFPVAVLYLGEKCLALISVRQLWD